VNAWILDPGAAAESPHAGGKARALALAESAGLPVPPWFVVSSHAFDDSLTPDQRRALDEARDAASLARTVADVQIAPAIIAAIEEAVRRLAPKAEPVAVRSSASDEDGAEHSFAGQLESFLNVPPADVAENGPVYVVLGPAACRAGVVAELARRHPALTVVALTGRDATSRTELPPGVTRLAPALGVREVAGRRYRKRLAAYA